MLRKILFLLWFSSVCSNYAISAEIGQLFLVDHFGAEYSHLHSKWIKEKSLGGMVFWTNGSQAESVRNTLKQYHSAAYNSDQNPPILSIDHEGEGVQRLRSNHGLTTLVSPNILGNTIKKAIAWGAKDPFEVCKLHGQIMTTELSATGFNSSLGTVADIYRPNRGTRNMFDTRGISDDPVIVANCVEAIFSGVNETAEFVYFTKHFPGLGSADGNTDVREAHSQAGVKEEAENLYPYQRVISYANSFSNGDHLNLGLMTSNAYYPHYDESRPAVESSNVQVDLLRGDLDFQGLVVTDALWVGKYEGLSTEDFQKEMAQIIIAGANLLMIPSSKFISVLDYLSDFYEGRAPKADLDYLLNYNKFRSYDEVLEVFRSRVDESIDLIKSARKHLSNNKFYQESNHQQPKDISSNQVSRYFQLIESNQISNGGLY